MSNRLPEKDVKAINEDIYERTKETFREYRKWEESSQKKMLLFR
jgi:hypothetical protein